MHIYQFHYNHGTDQKYQCLTNFTDTYQYLMTDDILLALFHQRQRSHLWILNKSLKSITGNQRFKFGTVHHIQNP